MPDWPAVIQYEGDDELIHVSSADAWQQDAEALLYNHHGNDRLIDSNGCIYKLVQRPDGSIHIDDGEEHIALNDFIKLVRIHASNSHRCCIEKISFRTFSEGIRLVADMNRHD